MGIEVGVVGDVVGKREEEREGLSEGGVVGLVSVAKGSIVGEEECVD